MGADDPPRQGWVPRLAGLLGSDTKVHNLGVSGTLTPSLAPRVTCVSPVRACSISTALERSALSVPQVS